MCDTLVALGTHTADGAVWFAKNSDREPGEAQLVEVVAGADHPSSSDVRCTYLSVPQAPRTHTVILSRPFWMWGAEMGVNEHGVAIGNEAVFTRMPYRRDGVLTGMDLLRLALERSGSAEQAVETIVALLYDHGQGGRCGYRDRNDVEQQGPVRLAEDLIDAIKELARAKRNRLAGKSEVSITVALVGDSRTGKSETAEKMEGILGLQLV